jgi:hypothetical protein
MSNKQCYICSKCGRTYYLLDKDEINIHFKNVDLGNIQDRNCEKGHKSNMHTIWKYRCGVERK